MISYAPTPRVEYARNADSSATTSPGLSEDEEGYIASAAALILPEPLHAAIEVDVVDFVNGLIASESADSRCVATPLHSSRQDGYAVSVLDQYRAGVSAVQRYCVLAHHTTFQNLSIRDKHFVLSLLEDGCPEAGLHENAGMFRLLVLHSSEAYFSDTQILLWERKG